MGLSGHMHIEEYLNKGPLGGFNESKKTNTEHNKTNVTSEKDNMASANQTKQKNARKIQVRTTYGLSTMASEPA